MRGALDVKGYEYERSGIIPADAGSTHFINDDLIHFQDHPRGCGEHGMDPALGDLDGGSSPRMRGAPT